jgi:hypothetical protein
LWTPKAPRQLLFDRYKRIAPQLRKASRKNKRGIYFERMITGGPRGHENQLEFVIRTHLSRNAVRRRVLQVGVFDPRRDHSAAAQLGELKRSSHSLTPRVIGATLGGLIGAILLLASGDTLFFQLVPWLLAIATALFTFARQLVKRVARYEVPGEAGPTVVTTPTPETLFPRCLLHPSAVAHVITSKFALGVPWRSSFCSRLWGSTCPISFS